jgi:hypothetical protein
MFDKRTVKMEEISAVLSTTQKRPTFGRVRRDEAHSHSVPLVLQLVHPFELPHLLAFLYEKKSDAVE